MKCCEDKQVAHSPVDVIQGDIRDVDWYDADIVYFANLLFSDILIATISELVGKLKKGARVISLRMLS